MNLPIEVIEAVDEGRCVLFVGSRFSMEAAEAVGREYPDGTALAKALGWKKPRQMMGTRPKPVTPSVEAAAAAMETQQGRLALVERLRELVDLSGIEPTEAHATAIRRFPLVFTTSRDGLLERQASVMGGAVEVLHRGDPVPSPDVSKRVVYKLVGGFDRPETLVITAADRARAALSPDVQKVVRNLIRKQVVFFVGYRPDEEEFERLWEDLTVCFGGELPRCHLAVAQGAINDFLWQKWVWRGLLLFTADPIECMTELESRIAQ